MTHLLADVKWACARAYLAFDKRVRVPRREWPTETADRYPGCLSERDVMVPMRDGVELATDVYRPADASGRVVAEPLPVILARQPYGKDEAYLSMPADGRYWARKGYVFVTQDVRGKFRSNGEWEMFAAEAQDGYDTIAWVAAQPWCDGKVGMMGESYYAFTQWAAASMPHPNLVCIAPGDMEIDLHEAVYQGGALCLSSTALWSCDQGDHRFVNFYRFDTRHLPLATLADHAGLPGRFYNQIVAHPTRDAYWDAYDFTDVFEGVAIPVFHWGGWYDNFLRGTLRGWRAVHERNPSAEVRADQWLTIGPTDHERTTERSGRAGRHRLEHGGQVYDRALAFFDFWLRRAHYDFAATRRVQVYVVGADRWREADEWPLPGTRYEKWYLQGGGRESERAAGALAPAPPAADDPPDTYAYDPRHPVDFWRGRNVWRMAAELADRRDVEDRRDVLTYTSAHLTEDLEVIGPLSVTLYAASSARDTDFTAALVDVWPDGHAQLVQEGIVRARYRESTSRPALIMPGEIYAYTIDLAATGYLFAAEHRLRVEISSSDFDRFDRNPNTGRDFGADARLKVAQQTVFHDAAHPSCIVLPLAAADGPAARVATSQA